MAHERKQRLIFRENGFPIGAVKLRIVKILALHTPRLAKDLFPLGAWIDTRFELGHVDWSIADLGRAIRGHDSP
jgi:hypothetical protein